MVTASGMVAHPAKSVSPRANVIVQSPEMLLANVLRRCGAYIMHSSWFLRVGAEIAAPLLRLPADTADSVSQIERRRPAVGSVIAA